jgi:hypothetical protein
MNAKQTAPLIAALAPLIAVAPPIIIGGAIGLGIGCLLKALLSGSKQKPSEATSVQASKEASKPAETLVFRQIPAEIQTTKQAAVLLASAPRAVSPPPTVQLVQKASVPAPPPQKIVVPLPQPPIKNKFVTREDVATAFHHGARVLTRTNAVEALKALGFGKTAAYAALTSGGRFAAWLQCAPDGRIAWTDARKT